MISTATGSQAAGSRPIRRSLDASDSSTVLDPRHPLVTPQGLAFLMGAPWSFVSGIAKGRNAWELRFEGGGRVTEVLVHDCRASYRRAGHQWSKTLAGLTRQLS